MGWKGNIAIEVDLDELLLKINTEVLIDELKSRKEAQKVNKYLNHITQISNHVHLEYVVDWFNSPFVS